MACLGWFADACGVSEMGVKVMVFVLALMVVRMGDEVAPPTVGENGRKVGDVEEEEVVFTWLLPWAPNPCARTFGGVVSDRGSNLIAFAADAVALPVDP